MVNLIKNTPKDELDLKLFIAGLIPQYISISDLTIENKIVGYSFHWINQGDSKLTIPMTEKEWLHAVYLAEQITDSDILDGGSPRYAYARELYLEVTNKEIQPFRASWKDRAIALSRIVTTTPVLKIK